MPSTRDSEVQRLHKLVSQREAKYLQIINDNVPSRIASVIENNFFTSIALYTFLLVISFLLSIFDKTAETDVAKQSKQLMSEVKQNFAEEREELNRHFGKVLADAKKTAASELERAKTTAESTAADLRAQLNKAKQSAQDQVNEYKSQLKQIKKELEQGQVELAKQVALAKETVDETKVQVSDLHYQLAEKEKRIHALESVETHLESELSKEKALHESSKEALHDAVEKLIAAKHELANARKPVA